MLDKIEKALIIARFESKIKLASIGLSGRLLS